MSFRARIVFAAMMAALFIGILVGCGGSGTTNEIIAPVASPTGQIPSPPVFDPLPPSTPLIVPSPSPSPA